MTRGADRKTIAQVTRPDLVRDADQAERCLTVSGEFPRVDCVSDRCGGLHGLDFRKGVKGKTQRNGGLVAAVENRGSMRGGDGIPTDNTTDCAADIDKDGASLIDENRSVEIPLSCFKGFSLAPVALGKIVKFQVAVNRVSRHDSFLPGKSKFAVSVCL